MTVFKSLESLNVSYFEEGGFAKLTEVKDVEMKASGIRNRSQMQCQASSGEKMEDEETQR